jgi:hypothetical protein
LRRERKREAGGGGPYPLGSPPDGRRVELLRPWRARELTERREQVGEEEGPGWAATVALGQMHRELFSPFLTAKMK